MTSRSSEREEDEAELLDADRLSNEGGVRTGMAGRAKWSGRLKRVRLLELATDDSAMGAMDMGEKYDPEVAASECACGKGVEGRATVVIVMVAVGRRAV